jgi:hypothetical protein
MARERRMRRQPNALSGAHVGPARNTSHQSKKFVG